MLGCQSDCVFCYDSLTGTGVSRNEYTIAHLETINCFFLKVVQREWIFPRHVGYELIKLNREISQL